MSKPTKHSKKTAARPVSATPSKQAENKPMKHRGSERPAEAIDPNAHQDSFAAATRTKERLAEIDPDELMIINRSALAIVTTIIAALPALQAQRPLFEKHLKTFDFAILDGLEDAANTLRVAQSALTAVKPEVDELGPYFNDAVAFRSLLVGDVTGLVRRGTLRESVLEELKGPPGYTNVANDFLVMVSHLRSNWEEASKKVSLEDLERAQATSDRLFYLAAQRDKADSALAEATLRRAQAYTLVVRSYEYLRAALTWIHVVEGKGGISEIAPSLAVVKRAGKSQEEQADQPGDRANGRNEKGEKDDSDERDEAVVEGGSKGESASSSETSSTGAAPADVVLGGLAKPFG
jgi:hypothetical protein